MPLVDTQTGLWQIGRASNTEAGQLDTPVVGGCTNGEGRLQRDDHLAGRPVKVRNDRTHITPSTARWEQSFSFDDGQTFDVHWIMRLARI